VRQCLRRIFGLIFRKIVLKDCRKFLGKVFPVQIVFELFTQKAFQRLKSPRSEQTQFQATPAQDLPFQGHHVGHEDLINNIGWLYRCADTAEKLIVGSCIFSFENRWRPEEAMVADRCRG
jgi:hypothetical protein